MNSPEFEQGLMRNEIVQASVAFIDICSFTTISEQEPPDVVVRLLNNYFDVMVKEIIAHNGYIDKFIGDAIMAVFRGEYHLDRAVESSLSIRQELGKIPDTSRNHHFSPMVSIGINSGEMISGNIGSVNLRRLDYTVIGDVVNTAQRLQSIAKDGQILITETAYNKIRESFNCNKLGDVNLKNKSDDVTLYEVLN
jgi:class 3 adenylate cyclase